jgi:hypothetical protein
MKTEITEDFIGIFDNVFDENLLNTYIEYYHKCIDMGLVKDRTEHAHHKISDSAVDVLTTPFYYPEINCKYISGDFIHTFWENCYKPYTQQYSIINEFGKHKIYDIKIQKTEPGQGYHMWHTENQGKESRDRLLAFTLYLNDVEEGGETEFLYLKKRYQPIKNRLLIWPAGFTHTHRGNQPISNSKYILTGWVEFGI